MADDQLDINSPSNLAARARSLAAGLRYSGDHETANLLLLLAYAAEDSVKSSRSPFKAVGFAVRAEVLHVYEDRNELGESFRSGESVQAQWVQGAFWHERKAKS